MKRKNHLGNMLQWKLFAFDHLNLPFVMSEYRPNRLPEEEADIHENGVLGISKVILEVNGEPEKYSLKMEKYFGVEVKKNNFINVGNTVLDVRESSVNKITSIQLLFNKVDEKVRSGLQEYNIESFVIRETSIYNSLKNH